MVHTMDKAGRKHFRLLVGIPVVVVAAMVTSTVVLVNRDSHVRATTVAVEVTTTTAPTSTTAATTTTTTRAFTTPTSTRVTPVPTTGAATPSTTQRSLSPPMVISGATAAQLATFEWSKLPDAPVGSGGADGPV